MSGGLSRPESEYQPRPTLNKSHLEGLGQGVREARHQVQRCLAHLVGEAQAWCGVCVGVAGVRTEARAREGGGGLDQSHIHITRVTHCCNAPSWAAGRPRWCSHPATVGPRLFLVLLLPAAGAAAGAAAVAGVCGVWWAGQRAPSEKGLIDLPILPSSVHPCAFLPTWMGTSASIGRMTKCSSTRVHMRCCTASLACCYYHYCVCG